MYKIDQIEANGVAYGRKSKLSKPFMEKNRDL